MGFAAQTPALPGHYVFFEIDEIIYGITNTAFANSVVSSSEMNTTGFQPFKTSRACNSIDERIAPAQPLDPAIGRLILGIGVGGSQGQTADCTAWIIGSAAFLTAGHCIDEDNIPLAVEFDYPDSDPDGTINFSDPDDQYPIDANSITFDNDLIGPNGAGSSNPGDDWGIFSTFPNANTGLWAAEARGTFFKLSAQPPALNTTIRVTGNGRDFTPAGTGGLDNAQNKTLQTHTGPFVGNYNTAAYEAIVDIAVGNSGSPIIADNQVVSFGIVTHGSQRDIVNPPLFCNAITQDLDEYEPNTVINSFPGNNTVYVDEEYPNISGNPYLQSTEDGSIFEPYYSFSSALDNASPGDQLFIASGTYNTATIDKAITLIAPVGDVTLEGGLGSPKTSDDSIPDPSERDIANNLQFSLKDNYPNPFSENSEIEFSIPTDSRVKLTIYDILGREVRLIVDEWMTEGVHVRSVNSTGLPNGVYFYTLVANNNIESKSMIVLR